MFRVSDSTGTAFFYNFDLSSNNLIPTTNGFQISGNTVSDQVGQSVRSAGDIDGDGYDDMIIGAYGWSSTRGIAIVLYGGPSSSFYDFNTGTTTLYPATTGFNIKGATTNDMLGGSLSKAGDINKDGYADILVGATGIVGTSKGVAYVIYGGPRSTMRNWDFSTDTLDYLSTGFRLTGRISDHFGTVATAGDINHDGYSDIIIGATGNANSLGAAYVIYGGEKSAMRNWDFASDTLDPHTTGFTIIGGATGDQLGWGVSTAGDINKDGYDDIIVGAAGWSNDKGMVYVIYGGEKSTMQNWNFASDTLAPLSTGFTLKGVVDNDQLGGFLSSAGDIDKDGYSDIMIAAQGALGGKGTAYVIYGGEKSSLPNRDFSSSSDALLPASTGFMMTGAAANDNFGSAVSAAGDLNKDGYPDIMIGAYRWDSSDRGAVYVIYGRGKSTMRNWDFSSDTLSALTTGFMIKGKTGGDLLGRSLSSGDFNKDQSSDIIIGVNGMGSLKGAAYVIYSCKGFLCNSCLTTTLVCAPCWGCQQTECNTCNSGAALCTDCANPSLLYQSQCTGTCPAATFPSTATCEACSAHCDVCSSATLCTKCFAPYLVSASQCVDSCPDTTFPLSGVCTGCSPYCNKCDSATHCTECLSSHNLYQSQCVDPCPDTTYPSAGVCESCSAHCNKCNSNIDCTQCLTPYNLYQSQCVSNCPDTTFASAGICEDCSPHCKQCDSAIHCTECLSPFNLYLSQCLLTCPDTTFASSGICEDCSTNCNHCDSASVCTECISPLYLYQSQCIPACPISTATYPGKCEDCPTHCFYCISKDSCLACSEGYTLSNAACVSSSYQQAQNRASKAIASAAQVIGGIVCVGSVTFPGTALVSSIVQNTRYLNLSVTDDLSGIYKTWSTDLISWDVPNLISNFDHFEEAPPLFYQYDLGSSFLANFWPTLVNMGIGLGTFITSFVLKKLLEVSEYNRGWAYSLSQKLMLGSFNFTLIQAYACLDNILFYLVLDAKTNPFNSFYSWTSIISASLFLALGCLLVFFNFWTVKKYQDIKSQNAKVLEKFNEKNKYWELFYSDFNDEDLLSQSFFAFLIMRSTLSSFIVTVLYDYPIMQTAYLIVLDGVIIIFLLLKNPFTTYRGMLCQYYFETITLLVHICTFILALQDTFQVSSSTLRTILSTGIIYLNTALVSGSIGFMFIEIYKTLSEKRRARRLKSVHPFPEETQEIQTLNQTTNPSHYPDPSPQKRLNYYNNEQDFLPENFHFFSGVHQKNNMPTNSRINRGPSHIFQDSNFHGETSVSSEMNISQIINEGHRDQSALPIMIQHRPRIQRPKPKRTRNMITNPPLNIEQF